MGWQLEIAKMALYMAFPVGCFHYFNQPEYFERWVIETKRKIYPSNIEDDRKMYEEVKARLLEAQEIKMMEAYQKNKK